MSLNYGDKVTISLGGKLVHATGKSDALPFTLLDSDSPANRDPVEFGDSVYLSTNSEYLSSIDSSESAVLSATPVAFTLNQNGSQDISTRNFILTSGDTSYAVNLTKVGSNGGDVVDDDPSIANSWWFWLIIVIIIIAIVLLIVFSVRKSKGEYVEYHTDKIYPRNGEKVTTTTRKEFSR